MKITPPADFHNSPQYLACTPKQRVWVDTFLATQDATVATQTAYAAVGESARTLTYAVRASRHVRAAVHIASGRSERDAFLDEVKRDIDHAPVGSDRRIRAEAMYARMTWGDQEPIAEKNSKPQAAAPTSAPAAPPERKVFYVGQRVTSRRKDGSLRFGIVTEIDSDGRALKFEDTPE